MAPKGPRGPGLVLVSSSPNADAFAARVDALFAWVDSVLKRLGIKQAMTLDDLRKITDVGAEVIMLVGRARTTSLSVRHTLHALQISGKEGIRAILNPFGHLGISRPTMRWVVLDAAVLRRIV